MTNENSPDWTPPVDPVLVLTTENFSETVDKAPLILVEFYAPWCGHCKKLAPTYDELGAKFASVDSVVIAKMDATANEIDVDGNGDATEDAVATVAAAAEDAAG